MNEYSEEEYVLLSGIQHMAFCERQWALIYIEQAWAENVRTIEGHHLHERVDDPFEDETRRDLKVVRAMPLVSKTLGLRGVADVVEFHREKVAIEGYACVLDDADGFWRPEPIEYKRGRPKPDDRDAVQLCAQAIALEEMMNVVIRSGHLYYGQTRHREPIVFDSALRKRTRELAQNMHRLLNDGKTPKARKGKHCRLCSLVGICQPKLTLKSAPVSDYLERMNKMGVSDV